MLMTMNTVACYRLHARARRAAFYQSVYEKSARKHLQRYMQCVPSKLTAEDRKHHKMTSKQRSGPLFGVRRPLRHLTEVLDLDDEQVQGVAGILDEMKLAYAQALLSRERARSAIATVFSAETPADADLSVDLQNALRGREAATASLNTELAQLLTQLFEVLDAEQRKGFAHMLRKGSFLL